MSTIHQKLDYSLKTMEERNDFTKKIIEENPNQTPRYLEILADYILDAMPKKEKRESKFLTENRLFTIHKYEVSLENLIDKFENNEDGIYNLFSEPDKNRYLTPQIKITDADLAEVPGLAELVQTIHELEDLIKKSTGRKKYILKKTLIEKRREQYILKNSYRMPANIIPSSRGSSSRGISLDGRRWVDESGIPHSTYPVDLFQEEHVAALLTYFPLLKETTRGQNDNDFLYLIEEFEALVTRALQRDYPHYLDIVHLKWDDKQNIEIQDFLLAHYKIFHTTEYLSCIWRSKVPRFIAQQAREDYLVWHYTYEEPEKAVWKKCSRCGQTKLAHQYFFSKNNTSKCGLYSICKDCRKKKGGMAKNGKSASTNENLSKM